MSTDSTPNEEVTEETTAAEAPAAAAETPVEEPAVAAPEVPSSDLPELTLGSGTGPGVDIDVDFVDVVRGKVDRFGVAMGTGRRKTAVARVRIKEGSGQFKVNGRSLDEFFGVERDREMVLAPLRLVNKLESVDVTVRVQGGGTTGQTGAIVLGIGRALQGMNPEFHQALADAGYLTRDSRMVERKKYGLRKARRSYQFSKR
jgi:small subunit ribosomal protein S9